MDIFNCASCVHQLRSCDYLHPKGWLASYSGSSQFFNDARRKTREPGKIHHVHDVRWKGLGAARA